MPRLHAPSCLTCLLVVLSSVAAAAGCAPADPPPAATGAAARAMPSTSSSPPAVPAPSAAERAGDDVVLAVRDADGEPVVGREVRLVDRRGAVRFGATDEEGGLVVEDVEAPYDALVAGAPGDEARSVPTAVLGLDRTQVALVVDERDPSPPPLPEKLRIAVLVPESLAGAEVLAVSSSWSGSGHAAASVGGGGQVVVLELEHAFTRGWTAAREEARVHVVVRAPGAAAYAEVAAGPVAPGETRDLGAVAVARVGYRAVLAEVDAARLPPSWARGSSAALHLDDGAVVPLGAVDGEALELGVPVVPGARLCVSAWAERPSVLGPDLHAGARTRACAPVEGAPPRVELAAESSPEVPRAGDGLARRGAGLRFASEESCSPCTRDVRLVHEARGRVVLRVVTSTPEVAFSRLSRLGAPALPLGSAVLDLGVLVGVRPEEALSDVAVPLDVARTSRRLRFVVTP